MIHFLNNLVSSDDCKMLVSEFYKQQKTKINADETHLLVNNKTTYGFKGYGEFDKLLNSLKPIITDLNGDKKIKNVNSFVREYKNGSVLKKHIDRSDIGITLSICLFSNIKNEWPLFAEYNNDEVSYNTNIGDGVLIINSDKITHWRDELVCNDDESVIQLFLHWKEISIDKNFLI
jgi:hypothetical protein